MAMVGVVKSFNPHKGWGFVTANGKDIFIMKKELKGYCVDAGDKIRFQPTPDEQGRMQARNITVMSSTSQKYLGEVKSFNENTGYGFITCEAIGSDVFVMSKDCQNGMCPVGGYCKFSVVQGQKGPTASDVYFLGKAGDNVAAMSGMWGGPPMMAMGGKGGWKGGGYGKGYGKNMVMQPMFQKMPMKGGKGWGKGSFKVDKSGGELGEFLGTIKSGGRSYGFIECPDAGYGDIFLHADERRAYQTGQTVKFTLILTAEGKAQAIKLKSGLK
eukprot:gnl/TRDRNA2_/TRDRNA2_171253_c0_seq1.p1 gnl/TRDRNA2_/TRDRNA2_171253_c0~~gnl/TRDRNA2_/TRDRNA2_171253_c0_seq1.p1  ORF type:complete len:271 (-),score=52.11 gnl/TRDRNA2_/TRDRNA2_171253_c0_seq1:692-1504(-)